MPRTLRAFGATLRSLRKRLGLTQERLAELCRLHPVFISEIERGMTNPSLETILVLSKALNMTPAQLLESAFPAKDSETANLAPEIAQTFNGQNERHQKIALAICRTYFQKIDSE